MKNITLEWEVSLNRTEKAERLFLTLVEINHSFTRKDCLFDGNNPVEGTKKEQVRETIIELMMDELGITEELDTFPDHVKNFYFILIEQNMMDYTDRMDGDYDPTYYSLDILAKSIERLLITAKELISLTE